MKKRIFAALLCFIMALAALLRIGYLSMKNIRQKVCAYLLEELHMQGDATFTLTKDRERLAEYLNIPRPSLSRQLCKLRDEGIIQFSRSTFCIMDPTKLEHYSG